MQTPQERKIAKTVRQRSGAIGDKQMTKHEGLGALFTQSTGASSCCQSFFGGFLAPSERQAAASSPDETVWGRCRRPPARSGSVVCTPRWFSRKGRHCGDLVRPQWVPSRQQVRGVTGYRDRVRKKDAAADVLGSAEKEIPAPCCLPQRHLGTTLQASGPPVASARGRLSGGP